MVSSIKHGNSCTIEGCEVSICVNEIDFVVYSDPVTARHTSWGYAKDTLLASRCYQTNETIELIVASQRELLI